MIAPAPPVGLFLGHTRTGSNGTASVKAFLNGSLIHADKLDTGRAAARERFAKAITDRCPGVNLADVEGELLRIAGELTAPAEPVAARPEVDEVVIVRPQLFHTTDISGLLVPTVTIVEGQPVGVWHLYLRWADGRREKTILQQALELPTGGRLWLYPQPAPPDLTTRAGWSTGGRSAWLSGAPAPEPAKLFQRLCERFGYYLELPPESATGDTATLALWVVLSYVYPAWQAVPYLSIGGPLGSGKSRVFELLARLVCRPLASANMTAPTLFRSLHENSGTLLLDEAERLRDHTPDAVELRSILLAGYKAGTPARRLEPTADGKFKSATFDVFGLKAIAGIAALPEALASRSIRLTMFRAAADSPKPRRRIDEDPEVWAGLRDDLHAMALEHGSVWLQLARRNDVCPAMSGRDFELWQPLLALAAWLDDAGVGGLLRLLQEHAAQTIELARDDATPDSDEILLKLLTEAVMADMHWNLTASELLKRANEREPVLFKRWSTKGVSNTLKRYGIGTSKSHGCRSYRDVTPGQLVRIQKVYGLDLGLTPETAALSVPAGT